MNSPPMDDRDGVIWYNGKLVPWRDAKVHVLSHSLHYGNAVFEGERIYILGAYGNTHCLDVKTGAVLWEKNIGHDYKVAEMACRPSPLIEGNLLILFTGAQPGACVIALEIATGTSRALPNP